MNKKAIKNTIIKLAKNELKRQVIKNLLSQENKDKLFDIVTNKFTSNINISSTENVKSQMYNIMTTWLASVNEYMNSIMINTNMSAPKWIDNSPKPPMGIGIMYYTLKYGNFKFIYKNCIINVKSFCPMKNFVSLNVSIYGKEKDRLNIINEINEFKDNIIKNSTSTINGVQFISYKKYSVDRGWNTIRGRELDTIYSDQINNIINIIYNWKHTEKMYGKHCLSFKTGLLLHGKPGTGKTSIAKAIATYFNMRLISVNLGTCPAKSIAKLGEEFRTIGFDPNVKTLVLLEEIDLNSNNQRQEKIQELLTILDGTESPNGIVFIATTNFIDNVDERIKREGRFDNVIEITDVCKETAIKMCEGFEVDPEKVLKNYNDTYRKDSDDLLYNPSKLQKKILLEYNDTRNSNDISDETINKVDDIKDFGAVCVPTNQSEYSINSEVRSTSI